MNEKEMNKQDGGEEKVREALELLAEMKTVNKRKGFRRIVEPVKKRERRRRIISVVGRYAAILLLLVGFVGVWRYTGKEVKSDFQERIMPGTNKAELILADGRSILLDTLSGEFLVSRDVPLSFSKDEGVFTYKKSHHANEIPQESGIAEGDGSLPEQNGSEEIPYNTLVVPRGGEYNIVLEDGTQVWLNADSRLKIPVPFAGKERRVYLEGEAYFEVTRDTARPFFVDSYRQTIRVTGTSFNLYDYPEEEETYTTLIEGEVIVSAEGIGTPCILKSGEQATLNIERGELTVKRIDVDQVTAWKHGMFVFEEQNLEQIMLKLSRWYNVEIVFLNEDIKELVFKGNLPRYGEFESILYILGKSSKLKFELEGRRVSVSAR